MAVGLITQDIMPGAYPHPIADANFFTSALLNEARFASSIKTSISDAYLLIRRFRITKEVSDSSDRICKSIGNAGALVPI
ncbi:hypothetical protein EMIT0P395_20163 [Pseudomonas sp. IT-P395]